MNKWMTASLSLALTATGAGCVGAKAEPPPRPEGTPVAVQTAAVKAAAMPNQLPLTGQLVANQQSDVAANGVGKVIRTLVDRGSVVGLGATLIQLDTKSAQLSQAEANANLQNAEASEDLARTLCKRTDELLQRGAISKEEWERTSSQCRTSTASLEAARARASIAEKTLSDATVRAPFAGLVGQRYVSVGEYVQPATRVVTLVELESAPAAAHRARGRRGKDQGGAGGALLGGRLPRPDLHRNAQVHRPHAAPDHARPHRRGSGEEP